MIKLSNGYEFEYMAASGVFGFSDRCWPWERPLCWLGLIDPSLFTLVTKTLTRYPRKGNPRWYLCVRPLRGGGFVNALGLPNPGIDWWCNHIGPSINPKTPLVVSIFSNEIGELYEMAEMLNRFNVVALEFDASCPNTGENLQNARFVIDGCKALSEASRFPIILKLSVVHDIGKIVPGVERIVGAFSINSAQWRIVFPDRQSPFAHLGGGGVSGKVAQKHTWRFAKRLVEITSVPVIWPSIWNYEDIAKAREFGAGAISFGSVSLIYPWRPTKFVRRGIKERILI